MAKWIVPGPNIQSIPRGLIKLEGTTTGRFYSGSSNLEEVSRNIDTTFEWRARGAKFIKPHDMETRHLFMTLIMIWNHTMPIEVRFTSSGKWQHHLYEFGPYYTREYMRRAIYAIVPELLKRHDMEPAWRDTIDKIVSFLSRNQIKD